MSGLLPLSRELGRYFDVRPVEQPQPVNTPVARCYSKLWPVEVRAEIAAIYATPDPFARDLNNQSANDKDEGETG